MTATVTRSKKTTGSNSASSRQPAQRDIVYDKGESELDRLLARHKTEQARVQRLGQLSNIN